MLESTNLPQISSGMKVKRGIPIETSWATLTMRIFLGICFMFLAATFLPHTTANAAPGDERRVEFRRLATALAMLDNCKPGLREWRALSEGSEPDLDMQSHLAALLLSVGEMGCFGHLANKSELLPPLRRAALNDQFRWYLDPPQSRDLATQARALQTVFGDNWLMQIAAEGHLTLVMAAADINLLCSQTTDHPLYSDRERTKREIRVRKVPPAKTAHMWIFQLCPVHLQVRRRVIIQCCRALCV